MTTGRRMGRAAVVVSAGILLSRVLGLVRNAAVAGLLGDTTAGDLYQAAFVIPDLLFYLMAGGYLSVTFIPILSSAMAKGDEEDAWRAFAVIAKVVAGVMAALTVVTFVLAPQFVRVVFERLPGLTGGELALSGADLDQLTGLMRIVLPAQFFFMLGSLLMGVQYARDRFLIPTLAPIVYNIGIILGGLIAWGMGAEGPAGFLWGALGGAIAGNFALQVVGARRVGLRWVRVRGLRHPALGEYLAMALPLMIGQSIAVLDEQFVRIASQWGDEGTIATLGLARALNMVPVGLLAQAAGVAAYPTLARLFAEGRRDEMRATLGRALRMVVFLGGLATAGILAASQPAVVVAYQRGAFGSDATVATASALALFALAIPFWGGHQLLGRAFYAQRRMWVPVGIGTAAALVSLPVYVWANERIGSHGIALASTIGIALYATGLGITWFRGHPDGREVLATLARTTVATIAAAAVGWLAVSGTTGPIESAGFARSALGLAVGAVVVVAAYGAVSRLLRSPELGMLRHGRNKVRGTKYEE